MSLDPITLSVIQSGLQQVCDEMDLSFSRAAFSPVIAEANDRLILCVNERAGPTTKADCLNLLWRTMVEEEGRTGTMFKAVVLHDAEDVVHADEIRLFDVMIDRFQLVQLPVLPLTGEGSWWSRAIANHYCDEFAEGAWPLAYVNDNDAEQVAQAA